MKNIKNESGRTMLEMLGVLGIMGILMYGAVTGINYGMSTYKINQVYHDVQDQMEGVMDLYSWSRYYVPQMTRSACENDVITTCYCTNSAQTVENCTADVKTTHPLGNGGIKIEGKTCGGTGNKDCQSFTLTYTDIGKDACERLKEMEWGTIKLTSPSGDCGDSNDMVWEPL